MTDLFETWKILCKQATSDDKVIKECYDEIKSAYQEPQRYYHTLEHIHDIVDEIQSASDPGLDKARLLWSAYFHDIVYNPKAKDNEQKSSEKAEQVMRLLHTPKSLILQVKDLILATANHTKAKPDVNMDFFLDCDLKILGATEEVYTVYAANIRKEYKHVPTVLYNYERKKVLKRFITTPAVYRTPHFYARYEKQARANMLNEIERL